MQEQCLQAAFYSMEIATEVDQQRTIVIGI
jgi:hypothetical protein